MSRWERFGTRDLAFSNWQRLLPAWSRMIDLDGCWYCPHCKSVLFLTEVAIDVGQTRKNYTITQQIAKRIGIPAFLVFYKKAEDGSVESFRVRRIAPSESELIAFTPENLEAYFHSLHIQHDIVCRAKGL